MRFHVTNLVNPQERHEYTFWLNDKLELTLDFYCHSFLPTQRSRNWRPEKKWSRVHHRESNISKPTVPFNVAEQALEKARKAIRLG